MQSNFITFLDNLALSPEVALAAVADNCRFDEQATDQRWERFESLLPHGNASSMTWADWAETCEKHTGRHINVVSNSIPDAFLEINRNAWVNGMADNQTLVRLESLARPLDGMYSDGTMAEKLEKLRSLIDEVDHKKNNDAEQLLASFFETWNRRRDGRALFAAFYDEVRAECDDADWPHALRDRLGLGHYGRHPGVPVPVAMMRYTVKEVLTAQKNKKLPAACALPTVLDGGMHEYFFPVPATCQFGATLHLDPSRAEVLTAEILHCRIDYKREHLFKVGFVSRPHVQSGANLMEARDLHLTALRIETGRHDFGEELRGRGCR